MLFCQISILLLQFLTPLLEDAFIFSQSFYSKLQEIDFLLVLDLQLLKSFSKICDILDLALLIHRKPQALSNMLKLLSLSSSLFGQFLQQKGLITTTSRPIKVKYSSTQYLQPKTFDFLRFLSNRNPSLPSTALLLLAAYSGRLPKRFQWSSSTPPTARLQDLWGQQRKNTTS